MVTNEADELVATAQYYGTMGTLIAQAGMLLGNALVAAPTGEGDVMAYLRQWVAFDPDSEGNPVPVTATAYVARAIVGDDLMVKSPEVEEVLAIIERWGMGTPALGITRTFKDLRELLGRAIALTTNDVNELTQVIHFLRSQLEVLRDQQEA